MLSFLTLCEKKQSHLKLHCLPRIGLIFVIFSVAVAAAAAVAGGIAAANKFPASFLKYGFNLSIYMV
jgi:hypothetical protein